MKNYIPINNPIFYDIETLPNIFTVVFINSNGKVIVFEVSERRNDFSKLRQFMQQMRGRSFVGYNNFHFDWPVMKYVLGLPPNATWQLVVRSARFKSDQIIKTNDRFNTTDWKPSHHQVDLMKIMHFDNKARMTSLKALQFAMKLPDIVEFNVGFENNLDPSLFDKLIDYNEYDVKSTKQFYETETIQKALELREGLGSKHDQDFMWSSDARIGTKMFQLRLEEELGRNICYSYGDDGERVTNQTKRSSISFKDIIFDYIAFESDEFNAVLDWLNGRTITGTKDVLTQLDESELGELAQYSNLAKRKGKVKNLNCMVDGFQFDFGTGGIHGSVKNRKFIATDEYMIMDSDVASLYPSIAISNRLFPEHLGEMFIEIYEDMRQQRFNTEPGSLINTALKLTLNASFGNSNNAFSYLYDPKFTMSITINGQLLLVMLIEPLLKLGELIQINTDGITMKIHRDNYEDYMKYCKQWEELTCLSLEHAEYKSVYQADVNNYVVVKKDGSSKLKGRFVTDRLYHQDSSNVVSKLAAVDFLTKGTDIEEFIRNHDDNYDFMLRAKVNKTDKLWLVDRSEEITTIKSKQNTRGEEQQKLSRYYVSSESNNYLVKQMPPKSRKWTKKLEGMLAKTDVELTTELKAEITKCLSSKTEYTGEVELPKHILAEVNPLKRYNQICEGSNVVITNKMPDTITDLDYDFYISEAAKLVDEFKF